MAGKSFKHNKIQVNCRGEEFFLHLNNLSSTKTFNELNYQLHTQGEFSPDEHKIQGISRRSENIAIKLRCKTQFLAHVGLEMENLVESMQRVDQKGILQLSPSGLICALKIVQSHSYFRKYFYWIFQEVMEIRNILIYAFSILFQARDNENS